MPPIPDGPGVYCWINTVNGKRYVGSSAHGVYGRRKQWLQSLRRGQGHNAHFQAAWNKYGETSFRFCVLERCGAGDCLSREQYWIDFYQACNRNLGYNLSPTAGSCLGCKRSAETRERLSQACKGRVASEDARAAMSMSSRRNWNRPGARQKRSAKYKQVYSNPSMRARLVDQAQKAGQLLKGKARSAEERAKIAAATRERMADPEVVKKLKEAWVRRKARQDLEGWNRGADGKFSKVE